MMESSDPRHLCDSIAIYASAIITAAERVPKINNERFIGTMASSNWAYARSRRMQTMERKNMRMRNR